MLYSALAKTAFHQPRDERRALADAKLCENAAHMLAYRIFTDAELLGDDLVAFPGDDEMRDLEFSARQECRRGERHELALAVGSVKEEVTDAVEIDEAGKLSTRRADGARSSRSCG